MTLDGAAGIELVPSVYMFPLAILSSSKRKHTEMLAGLWCTDVETEQENSTLVNSSGSRVTQS